MKELMTMAEAPKRASAKTTLKWGTIEVPVGLFKTVADPEKEIKFGQAGPNGGELKVRAKEEETPVEALTREDPLAVDPGSDVPPAVAEEIIETRTAADAAEAKVGAPAVPVLVEEGSGAIVERDQIRHGVWLAVGDEENASGARFVDCTDALEHIDTITALEVMEIQGAIDVGRVPRERVTGSYYVGIDGEGTQKVLALLFEAMRDTRRALVVKWTKTKRQASGVLVPSSRGGAPTLLLLQLAWPEDWRGIPKRAALTDGVKAISAAEKDKARELVAAMADSSLLLEEQRDDALALREEVHALALDDRIDRFKMPEKPVETPLLDSLEASLDAELAKV